MARENLTNFANTTLGSTINSAALSFTVATGGGNNFPTVSTTEPRSFVVSIDTELILCSGRSGDTFTVATGGRGWEGTTPATHSSGASVGLAITAGMVNHIWSSLSDSFNIDVPQYARALGATSPSAWDDEFEATSGLWTTYPVDAGATFDFGATYFSQMQFSRTDGNNTLYWMYQPFAPGTGSWQVTAKLSHGYRQLGYGSSAVPRIEAGLFVSDQANPTAGESVGNMVLLDHSFHGGYVTSFISSSTGNKNTLSPFYRATAVNSSTSNFLAWIIPEGEKYMRIAYNGNGLYMFYVGDGLTWRGITSVNKTILPASMGFRFLVSGAAGMHLSDTTMIDWVRVVQGISFN